MELCIGAVYSLDFMLTIMIALNLVSFTFIHFCQLFELLDFGCRYSVKLPCIKNVSSFFNFEIDIAKQLLFLKHRK